MVYRFLRGFNEIYPLAALFGFIAAFFVAFAFTIIYPLVPIVLMISSIFVVVGVRLVYLGMRGLERSVARGALLKGKCPACSSPCDAVLVGERRVQECPGCRRIFTAAGDPYVPQEVPEDAQSNARFEQPEGAAELA